MPKPKTPLGKSAKHVFDKIVVQRMGILKENGGTGEKKKKRRDKKKFLREIVREQKRTDFAIPRAPFKRLVHETIQQVMQERPSSENAGDMRVTAEAVEALQAGTEDLLTDFMRIGNLGTNHRSRMTLIDKDVHNTLKIWAMLYPDGFAATLRDQFAPIVHTKNLKEAKKEVAARVATVKPLKTSPAVEHLPLPPQAMNATTVN